MEMESIKKPHGSVRIIIRLSIMLLALVITVVSIAYSWFSNNTEGYVNDIEINVAEAYNLLVSDGAIVGTKKLELAYDEGFTLKAVAGDGKNFFQPVRELQDVGETGGEFSTKGYGAVVGYTEMSPAEIDESVYSHDFSLSIESNCQLVLSAGSQAVNADLGENEKASPYGGVDTGAIVGAVRIAFFQEINGNYELVALWIPDITTELTNNNGVYAVTENGTAEESVAFVFDSFDPNDEANGGKALSDCVRPVLTTEKPYTEEDGITYIWGPVTTDVPLGQLVGDVENNFRLVVWIDGNDRECENALLEGVVSLKINFAVMEASEATETE